MIYLIESKETIISGVTIQNRQSGQDNRLDWDYWGWAESRLVRGKGKWYPILSLSWAPITGTGIENDCSQNMGRIAKIFKITKINMGLT